MAIIFTSSTPTHALERTVHKLRLRVPFPLRFSRPVGAGVGAHFRECHSMSV